MKQSQASKLERRGPPIDALRLLRAGRGGPLVVRMSRREPQEKAKFRGEDAAHHPKPWCRVVIVRSKEKYKSDAAIPKRKKPKSLRSDPIDTCEPPNLPVDRHSL